MILLIDAMWKLNAYYLFVACYCMLLSGLGYAQSTSSTFNNRALNLALPKPETHFGSNWRNELEQAGIYSREGRFRYALPLISPTATAPGLFMTYGKTTPQSSDKGVVLFTRIKLK
jgi:hypothetical protein